MKKISTPMLALLLAFMAGIKQTVSQLETPPTLTGYTVPGGTVKQGYCAGDNLYRTMSYMSLTIADGDEDLAGKAPRCAELCTNASVAMNRCMGFQVTGKGNCYLYDRDWTYADKAPAESALSGVTLSDAGVRTDFAGLHLVHLNSDPYLLSLSSEKGIACYRRTIDCSSATTTACNTANRYECALGKVANNCDLCKPRYSDANAVGMSTCAKTNNNVPTLRIGFANPTWTLEDDGDTRGANQAYLTAAYAMKWAWENNYAFLPSGTNLVTDRQNFNIEFYSYTENLTLATTLPVGGTEQVSSSDVTPGLRAISGVSGGSYATDLEIKEPPANTKVHAVLGGFLSSLKSEEALMAMGEQFQTPVLGYRFTDARLKSPYYIRTNRVALNAGSAIGKLLQTIGYDQITVVEQPTEPTVKDQLVSFLPSSTTFYAERPSSKTAQGACAGGKTCTSGIIDIWKKVREDDRRVIVHEMGGDSFEFYLLMSTDLLSSKTMYVQTGHKCDYVNLMGDLGWAQAYDRAIDNANFSQCQVCPNLIQYLGVPDSLKKNWTYTALYLFSDNNPYKAYQTLWCPQFPTVEDLLACTYCSGLDSVFASTECGPMQDKFSDMLSRSVCVEADLSGDITVKEAYQNLLDCPGMDPTACSQNYTEASYNYTSLLTSVGFPSTYLAPYQPGGALWNMGLASSKGRPFSMSAAWTDVDLCGALGIVCLVNIFRYEFMDALVTAIVGFNEFVKHGGDVDADSDPTASPTSMRLGNSVAGGWRKFLLDAEFGGMGGSVNYVSEGKDVGERSIIYKYYQMIPGSDVGCFLTTTSSDPTANGLNVRYVASTWNFKYVPEETGHGGDVKLATPGGANEKGCDPFPAGYFTGKVAMIKRGTCYFGTKALNAQNAGAISMLVYNTAGDIAPFMSADDPTLVKSGVALGTTDAKKIWDAVEGGSPVSVTLLQATSCFDPKFSGTLGLSVYMQTMSYNLKTDVLSASDGNTIACTGAANTPARECPQIVFNGDTNKAPQQSPDSCGDGYEYSLAARECLACAAGKYKLTSAGDICRPCLAGQYAAGTGNIGCTQCGAGTYSSAASGGCSDCLAGTYSGKGSEQCSDCVPGYFAAASQSSQCTICTAGEYSNASASICTKCQAGFFSDHGSAACTQCPGGKSASGLGNMVCTVCEAGSFALAGSGSCTTCTEGKYAKDPELTTCESCDLGTFASAPGALGCVDCSPGQFAHQVGSSACTACSLGEYTSDKRSTSCVRCGLGSMGAITGAANCTLCSPGTYQSERGQTSCVHCQSVITGSTSERGAESSDMCVCHKGESYRPGVETCVECQVGMTCPKGKGIPTQRIGYSIEIVDAATREYASYECALEKWCPEGPPETCGGKRFGRSCARIKGEDCPVWAPWLLTFGIVSALYALYRMSEHSTYGKVSALMIMGGNLGIAVNAMQSANVYLQFFQEVPIELDWMMALAEIFMFKLNNVIPECHMGQGFTARLFVSVLPPLTIVGAYAGLLIVTRLLSKVNLTKPMTIENTVNAAGMLIQVMYIMQCKDAFSYFSSKENPSGKETLQDYTDIVIWSDEHVSAGPLIIMIYLWLVYVIGTYCVFAWVVAVTKKRISDKRFRQMWRFILARWRPDCWYWGMFLLARNFFIAIIPITVRVDKVYRVLVFAMLLACHALAEVHWMPWMTGMNNWFEALISMLLIVMGIVGLQFTPSATKADKVAAAAFMAVLLCGVWLLLLFSFTFALHWNSPKQAKARRAANHEGAENLTDKFCAIRELMDSDDQEEKKRWTDFTKNSSSYDQTLLKNMNKYIDEFEQNDVLRRRYSSWRSRTSELEKDEPETPQAPETQKPPPQDVDEPVNAIATDDVPVGKALENGEHGPQNEEKLATV